MRPRLAEVCSAAPMRLRLAEVGSAAPMRLRLAEVCSAAPMRLRLKPSGDEAARDALAAYIVWICVPRRAWNLYYPSSAIALL